MIREAAQDIFNRNTDYSQPHQVVNQLESLNVMSLDLYTDAYRFVYELLQNADDSVDNGKKVRVAIRLIEDYLIVAHTGKPFDERDLNGIVA